MRSIRRSSCALACGWATRSDSAPRFSTIRIKKFGRPNMPPESFVPIRGSRFSAQSDTQRRIVPRQRLTLICLKHKRSHTQANRQRRSDRKKSDPHTPSSIVPAVPIECRQSSTGLFDGRRRTTRSMNRRSRWNRRFRNFFYGPEGCVLKAEWRVSRQPTE